MLVTAETPPGLHIMLNHNMTIIFNLVCENHYEEKCVKMPKKVAIKVILSVRRQGGALYNLAGSQTQMYLASENSPR